MKSGTLYVVATPIGNLGDITSRALEVLEAVDLVAAEDTRVSGRLLKHFGVKTPLLSVHEHNEQARIEALLGRLEQGESIALISDAGTPLVSDPGYRLVRATRAAGFQVVPIPGASALLAALSAAGLPTDRFVFEGFLPPKPAARRQHLQGLAREQRTLVFYESAHRLLASVDDMAQELGPARRAVLARELTKLHEEFHGDTLGNLGAWIQADANRQRGEFVILVAGADEAGVAEEALDPDVVLATLLDELPVKQAVRIAARLTSVARNDLYQRALKMQQQKDGAP
jgi:16S rRNA (cytidine1402-2'-O)-methyltransferase